MREMLRDSDHSANCNPMRNSQKVTFLQVTHLWFARTYTVQAQTNLHGCIPDSLPHEMFWSDPVSVTAVPADDPCRVN